MRLWSIHPKYLDSVGLVALWRESLLAQKVLEGSCRGYNHHPQLIRFRNDNRSIGSYLYGVYHQAQKRGYNFDLSKITDYNLDVRLLPIENGQLDYEFDHLMAKLTIRAPHLVISKPATITPHPLFYRVDGGVCSWEKV